MKPLLDNGHRIGNRTGRRKTIALGLLVGGASFWAFTGSSDESDASNRSEAETAILPSPQVRLVRGFDADESAQADRRAARMEIDGEVGYLRPNARGDFPRLYVSPGAVVTAEVAFDTAAPGAAVTIEAEDGGRVVGEGSGRVTLDAARRATYRLELPSHEGAHRVTVRHGNERKTFEFWIGDEPPLFVRR